MKTLYAQRKTLLFISAIFLKVSLAVGQLKIDIGHYQIDKNLRLVICNTIPDKIIAGTITIDLEKTYAFATPVNTLQIGKAYDVSSNDTTYKLYFTRLPLINLTVKNEISSTEIGGFIGITDTTGIAYNSAIGIKIRGAYSSTLPKKSYRVQLWADSKGKTKDESLFGLRSDKRWLMLAMYNEKLRLNNRVSHDIWLKMHKLYYADQEPNAHSAIRTRYVEAFLNGAYQGVYLFTEDMDRKQLQLKKHATAGTGGELYKGGSWGDGTQFIGIPDLPVEETELWGGWELSYPDADQTDWVNIRNFTEFVVNASDSTFKQQISTKIREDNFADYLIFLNLIRAEDNLGKNLFLARYDETAPYFIAPWDLDGTWGYYWGGDQKDITEDILSNNLFNRLLANRANFKAQLATRWFSLRANTLSTDSLLAAVLTNYTFLMNNGVYERENRVWAGQYLSYGESELNYIKSWIQRRVIWLDAYFKTFVGDQPIIYSFKADTTNAGIVLNWSANCPAIRTFDVEASSNQQTWHTVMPNSLVATDSTTCTYSFTDSDPETNASYYRLKVTDKNNGISYSSILEVNLKWPLSTSVSVFPNPVSTTLQIRGDVEQVTIYSLLGKAVYQGSGTASGFIDMQQLPTGLYVVRINQKNGVVTSHRVVVSH